MSREMSPLVAAQVPTPRPVRSAVALPANCDTRATSDHVGAVTPCHRPIPVQRCRDLWCRQGTGASRHTQCARRRTGPAPRLLLRQPNHQPMPPMQIELRTRLQLDRAHIARLVDPAVRILQRNKYLHALPIGTERSKPKPASAAGEERPVPFAALLLEMRGRYGRPRPRGREGQPLDLTTLTGRAEPVRSGESLPARGALSIDRGQVGSASLWIARSARSFARSQQKDASIRYSPAPSRTRTAAPGRTASLVVELRKPGRIRPVGPVQ
jgi:hypothetical protein